MVSPRRTRGNSNKNFAPTTKQNKNQVSGKKKQLPGSTDDASLPLKPPALPPTPQISIDSLPHNELPAVQIGDELPAIQTDDCGS